MNLRHLLGLLALVLLPFGSAAQWVWLDKDGSKVYSDRSPPGSIPEKSILKRPGQRPSDANTASAVSADKPVDAGSVGAGQLPKLTGVDKTLADRKAKAERAEQDKQKAAEAKIAASKADNCARAKFAKATLDSGLRLSRVNSKGEQEIMDDAARAAEAKRLQGIMAVDCQ
jgi:hypothetical protein